MPPCICCDAHIIPIAHETQVDDDDEISDEALKAAIDFVQTSIQHAAYISGDQLLLKKLRVAEYGMCEEL